MATRTGAPKPASLCTQCQGIVFNDETGSAHDPEWKRVDTLPDLPSLTSSAEAGCGFCAYLRFVFRETPPPRRADALSRAKHGSSVAVTLDTPPFVMQSGQVEFSSWGTAVYSDLPDGLLYMNLCFHHENWAQPWRSRAWVYSETERVTNHLGISLRLPASNVLEPTSLACIREWLSECRFNHPQCHAPITPSLPTRLIDIGAGNGPDPQLVASKSLPSSTPYIALSYCWGPPSQTKPQLTTVTSRLPAHQSGIPVSSMPLTFQDLIALSRELGVRYVWIDALCIIQDDAADWEREAARMYSVYRDAYLTVVVGGPSCHSGFLKRADPGIYASVPFRSRKDANIAGSYLLHHRNVHRTWEAEAPHHMSQSAWSRRAWTFQEDIMSTRVLYFTESAGFFRCQTKRSLEQSIHSHSNVRDWHRLFYSSPDDSEKAIPLKKREYLYRLWNNLFITYAERRLTKDRDRLPALSGLARIFSSALRDEYVAGLWRGDIIRGLLWYMYSDSARPTGWRAPSWSWASRLGIVELLPQHDEPIMSRCFIEGIHVQPAGQDSFGMLKDGWIILRGCLRPVRLCPGDTDDGGFGYADVIDAEHGTRVEGSIDSISMSGSRHNSTFQPPPVAQLLDIQNVSALLIALICNRQPRREGDVDDDDEFKWPQPSIPAGLLVVPVDGAHGESAQPLYTRIGLFSATGMHSQKDVWENAPKTRLRLV